jgi:hypothetical protein
MLTLFTADNSLSFIETSALDASNVELAFQNILTGLYNEFSEQVFQSEESALTAPKRSIVSSPAKPSIKEKVQAQCQAASAWCSTRLKSLAKDKGRTTAAEAVHFSTLLRDSNSQSLLVTFKPGVENDPQPVASGSSPNDSTSRVPDTETDILDTIMEEE